MYREVKPPKERIEKMKEQIMTSHEWKSYLGIEEERWETMIQ